MDIVIAACDVPFDDPRCAWGSSRHISERGHAASLRAKAVGAVAEVLLIDGFQEHLEGALHYPILDGRHIPSTLHQNPNRLWDSSRLSIPITPCGGSAAKSSACAAVLSPTSSSACRTAPAPPLP